MYNAHWIHSLPYSKFIELTLIYYSTNSWNFTRIGKIDNTNGAQLKSALGNGDVTVTLSLGK